MATSHVINHLHVIFATQERTKWLHAEHRPMIHAYLGGVFRGEGATPVEIGGVEDHVHALIQLHPSRALSDVMREVKKASNSFIRQKLRLPQFAWQSGYAAFSVGKDQVPRIRTYIQGQVEHHKSVDWREELMRICREEGIDIDPRDFK